jgi:hypothetical protein
MSDWESEAHLHAMQDCATVGQLRVLVAAAIGSGEPDAKQRKFLHQTLPVERVRLAVLTESRITRGALTAIS